jgi:hypothetical protein
VPVLVALALVAVDRVCPHLGPAPAPPRATRAWRTVAGLLALAVAAALFLLMDRYRRLDLRGARDGPYVLAFVRETLRTAGRLERGQAVSFDAPTQRFAWGESDPGDLSRMRWFLRGGWGALAHYGTGEIVMQEGEATLVIPCFHPRDLELELVIDGPPGARLQIAVNGRAVGETPAGGGRMVATIPAGALFRGDNVATLTSSTGAGGARLRRLGLAARP